MNPASDAGIFTERLLNEGGAQATDLLQYLCSIQQHYSCIPPQAVETLARVLALTPAVVLGVIEFYSFLHRTPRGQFDILVSDSITDHMLGSRDLLQRLCDRLGVCVSQPGSDGRATVATTSCTGMCDQGPALLINGQVVTRVDNERLDRIVALVQAGSPLEDWPQDWFSVSDNVYRRDQLLDEHSANGDSLRVLLDRGAADLLQELDDSGLRGRGGAGFSTALKWKLCRDASADERYVVCNADEGEPGTFKDRVLLQSWADTVFEGMTLCAGIIGARRGFLYLRGEYRYLLDSLHTALENRRASGLLGSAILGEPGFDFDIDIHLGAGAYICGEESALIESLEGKRGIPRIRPPFPVTSGYRNRPTVVNNVETFMAAVRIAEHGSAWFRSKGTAQSPGTKLLSISGDCRDRGVYEYPLGVSIEEVLSDCGADDVQAVQVAGAAGRTLPPAEFGRTLAFEDVATGGSFMVFDHTRDVLDVVLNFTRFFAHESCGFCTPCRVGGSLLRDLVEKLHDGHGSEYDIREMRDIAGLMQAASHCGLGHTAPAPVLDLLDHFPDVWRQRLAAGGFEPSFDIDAALSEAKQLTGRDHSGGRMGGDV